MTTQFQQTILNRVVATDTPSLARARACRHNIAHLPDERSNTSAIDFSRIRSFTSKRCLRPRLAQPIIVGYHSVCYVLMNKELEVKLLLSAAMILVFSEVAFAFPDHGNQSRVQVADASDACVANCASQSASCKRVCPTTFNTPCLNACDSQAQTCRQSCQAK
jgi:hypothetical protein